MPTVIQHVLGASTANAVTLAITISAAGTGNALLVGTGNAGDRTVTGISDGTNSLTQATNTPATWGAFSLGTDGWYLLSTTPGATTITITFSGAAGTFAKYGEVWEVSGIINPQFDAGNNTSDGVGASDIMTGPSLNMTRSGFVAAIVTGQSGNGDITVNPSVGNEFVSGGDISSDTFFAGCSYIENSISGTHQPKWTSGSSSPNFCASVFAIKENKMPVQPYSYADFPKAMLRR